MIYFTKGSQFTTRLQENTVNIKVVTKFKLLGTWITNDLMYDMNTQCIV